MSVIDFKSNVTFGDGLKSHNYWEMNSALIDLAAIKKNVLLVKGFTSESP